MHFDNIFRLYEHAGRATARIVDSRLVRRGHPDQHADDAARRGKLPAVFFLRAGELREEVLVDAARDVLRAVHVRVFGIGSFVHFGEQLLMPFLKGVGDVFQEDQAEFELGRGDVVAVCRRPARAWLRSRDSRRCQWISWFWIGR